MRHHLFQRPLPLAGRARAGTAVWTELACILVICLLRVHQRNGTATGGVFAGEHHITRHLLHGQITNVTQWTPARGATGELRPAIRADQMSALTLQDRWKHVVETDGTLEETRQVGGAAQGGYGRRGGTRDPPPPLARVDV